MTQTQTSSRRWGTGSVALVLGVAALAGAQPPEPASPAPEQPASPESRNPFEHVQLGVTIEGCDHQSTFTVGLVWWFGNKQGLW